MLSDQDLMMVENLTYQMKGDIIKGSSFDPEKTDFKPLKNCDTVDEYLQQFDEDMLSQMDAQVNETYSGEMSGAEWAATIRYMKGNEEISSLEIADCNKDIGAICFVSEEGEAIVAFRGTTGPREWKDNTEGLNQADTECQREALEYVESLPYDDMTVVGHSKGGNKAQYVTIVAEEGKIGRCVSMDGQGFSQEFYDKYGANVQERYGKISCYSLSADFVNILLFPVPGVPQIYIKGGGDVDSIGQNHSPNAFFEFKKDKNGNWIIVEENGEPKLGPRVPKSDLAILQDFIAFYMNNASEEDKKIMVDFLGPLLAGVMAGGAEKWSEDQIVEHLMNNSDALAMFVAYLIKYIEVFDISQADVVKMLDSLGISDALLIALGVADAFLEISDFVKFLIDNITDGKKDWIIETIVKFLGGNAGKDIMTVWNKIEDVYGDLDDVKADTSKAKILIFDYSAECYNRVIESIKSFRAQGMPGVSGWNGYGEYSWFNKLLISVVIKCINTYREAMDAICDEWKERADRQFREIWDADQACAAKLTTVSGDIQTTSAKVKANLL